MNGNFEQCLALVLHSEGGFVNNPQDPGGMTNLGVTKVTYEGYVNRHVDEAEMRSLTPDLVAPLYKKMYWDRIKGDDLPVGVDYCLFDLAVNSGVGKQIQLKTPIALGTKSLFTGYSSSTVYISSTYLLQGNNCLIY